MTCSFCDSELKDKILDLGFTPLANTYLPADNSNKEETYYPLQVYTCSACLLVQLSTKVNPQHIFNNEYAYISSSSQTWIQHCKDYVTEMCGSLPTSNEKTVLEIGCNDGVLLAEFKKKGFQVLGIDPADTSAAIARKNGVQVVSSFFSYKMAEELVKDGVSASLIIGNNVLAHVPNINDFFSGLTVLLNDAGVCTLEVPYLPELIANGEFDTVYHEHYFYFSLTSLQTISSYYGLQIVDVKRLSIHGGSIRIYLRKNDAGIHIHPNVSKLLLEEDAAGMKSIHYYLGLQKNAFQIKNKFWNWLVDALSKNYKIAAYGAAAKGNTFLNYCGVKNDMIAFVADVTVQKQSKLLPGSHIPIVDELYIAEVKPDFIIILPWNFKREINNRLSFVKEWNAKLVYFIPFFEVVE